MSLTKVSYSMINGASVNVLDFGADPTGVADSRAAIQAAIDYAYSLRDLVSLSRQPAVYFPAGKYLVSDSLVAYDYTTIIGEGIRNSFIVGTLASKSIIRPQYGETPTYAQRTIGWNIQNISINNLSPADGIGLNFGNVGYSWVSNVSAGGYTGLVCTHRTYYSFFVNLTLTGFICADLQSDGGGNEFVNPNFGFTGTNSIGVKIRSGTWGFQGGVIDTGDATALSCMDVGSDGGTPSATVGISNLYAEAVNAGTFAIRFFDSTVQSSVFGLQRRNVIGAVTYSATTNTTGIINISPTGQFNTQSRVIQQAFSRNYNNIDGGIIGKEGGTLLVTAGDLATAGNLSVSSLMIGGGSFSSTGIYSGVGSPQGVLTAATGSLYLNTSGGANTTLYVKESGSGNTGWVAK